VAGIHLALANLDDRTGVGDTRRRSQQHRSIVVLADFQPNADEILAFLAVDWLQHWDFGEPRIMAVVLLILRGMQPGIICRDDD
jgi:hypothetical protein